MRATRVGVSRAKTACSQGIFYISIHTPNVRAPPRTFCTVVWCGSGCHWCVPPPGLMAGTPHSAKVRPQEFVVSLWVWVFDLFSYQGSRFCVALRHALHVGRGDVTLRLAGCQPPINTAGTGLQKTCNRRGNANAQHLKRHACPCMPSALLGVGRGQQEQVRNPLETQGQVCSMPQALYRRHCHSNTCEEVLLPAALYTDAM